MDPVEIAAAIRILSGLVLDLAKAMQGLKEGNPEDIDIEGIIKTLENLPDLPTGDDD